MNFIKKFLFFKFLFQTVTITTRPSAYDLKILKRKIVLQEACNLWWYHLSKGHFQSQTLKIFWRRSRNNLIQTLSHSSCEDCCYVDNMPRMGYDSLLTLSLLMSLAHVSEHIPKATGAKTQQRLTEREMKQHFLSPACALSTRWTKCFRAFTVNLYSNCQCSRDANNQMA